MHDHINYIFLLKPTNWHAVIVDSMYLYNLLILIMVSGDDANVIDVCLKIKHDVHVHLHIIIYIYLHIFIYLSMLGQFHIVPMINQYNVM